MCLIKNNAKVAAQIAVALGQLQLDCGGVEKLHGAGEDEAVNNGAPVVIGGSILDVHYRVLDDGLEVSCFATWTFLHNLNKGNGHVKANNCFPGNALSKLNGEGLGCCFADVGSEI